LDGQRQDLDEVGWFSTRDHSWGVRYMVGAPVEDVAPRPEVPGLASLVLWSPMLLERADGSRFGVHVYYQRHAVAGYERLEVQGGTEHPDGTREPFTAVVPDLGFRDDNRRLLGGTLHCTTADGTERPLPLPPLGETGFHLGTGLYFGFEGHWHGEWRGPLHVDGEHVADCADVATAHRIHQFRDCVMKVEDPVGGGSGWGNAQTLATGPHPDLGLTEEASF